MKRVAAILAITILFGCGLPRMTNPGVSPAQFKRDSYECERDAREYISGGGFGMMDVNYDLYQKCMEARGYNRR